MAGTGGRQSGNAVVFLLLAIALFSGLAYTFMRGGAGGVSQMSAQQARLAAADLISYAGRVERGIGKLIAGGCSEKQLSFAGSGLPGYTNGSTPSDLHCEVFNAAGAGVTYIAPDTKMLLQTQSSQPHFGQHLFTGYTCFAPNPMPNCGADPSDKRVWDITMFTPYLTRDVCAAINRALGVDAIAIDGSNAWYASGPAQYVGVFNDGGTLGNTNIAWPQSLSAGCYQAGPGAVYPVAGTYYFFKILLFRDK